MLYEGILPTYAAFGFGILFISLLAQAALSPSSLLATNACLATQCASIGTLRPAILVTIGWCALYFCFLQCQSAAAFWIHKVKREEGGKKDDLAARRESGKSSGITFASVKYSGRANTSGLIFVMDRSVGNMLEQTPPFLLGVWLHAIAVSPEDAAWYGWFWLVMRATYPIMFAHPSMSPALWNAQRRFGISWVSFVTWPSYAVVWRLLYGAAKVCW